MFAINTCFKRYPQLLNDWFIVVNGRKCKCDRAIAEQISPIIHDFYQEKNNENLMFATDILDNQICSENPLNSESPLSSLGVINSKQIDLICLMISKVFCGEEIILKEENISILLLIGKHFKIQEIIYTIEEYQKYFDMISSGLKNSIEYKEMKELEKLLLLEMNETNIDEKVKENIILIKKISVDCFIYFVINIGFKNFNIRKSSPSEFVIEIIKSVNQIIPETQQHFISIMFHIFAYINSCAIGYIDKFYQYGINSLINQMFVDRLVENITEKTKILHDEIKIPIDMEKYFVKKEFFLELSNEYRAHNIKGEITGNFDDFFDLIKYDEVISFHDYLVSSKKDIDLIMKSDNKNKIFFIDDIKEYTLIEIAAFLGSIKCFTYLCNKQAKIDKNRLSNFAAAGGNPEIIHICEREECIFNVRTLDISIEYHNHNITKWLVETKNIAINERILRNCMIYYNIRTMKYLIKKGISVNKIVIYICESNNIILCQWLSGLMKNYSIKLIYQENKKTALHIACEQNNAEIAKLLILSHNIDINSKCEANINNFFYYALFHIYSAIQIFIML